MGFKFRRQVPRGRYVVDFLCLDASLVVEVDGSQHADRLARRDKERTVYLEAQGLKVLRVWNVDVLTNLEGVLALIAEALAQRSSPSPGAQSAPSSPQGERGTVPVASSE
jgi:very-short-patch-repair endonuclease